MGSGRRPLNENEAFGGIEMRKLFLTASLLILSAFDAFADATSKVVYHGRILKRDGTPLEGLVKFKIQIRSPGGEDCLLFEETHDRLLVNGIFSLTIGEGTPGNHNLDLVEVFQNHGTFNGLTECAQGSSYKAETNHGRRLRISFVDPETNHEEKIPDATVNLRKRSFRNFWTLSTIS